jgi:hypothetical protein
MISLQNGGDNLNNSSTRACIFRSTRSEPRRDSPFNPQNTVLAMSDPIDSFKAPNGWDVHSSRAAGQHQAQQGQTSSPQQANESWLAYQNRQAAYDANKQK